MTDPTSTDATPADIRVVLVNKILSWVVSIIESQSMRLLEGRISLLVSGGWLPGQGDVRTIAALTARPEDSIEDIAADCPRAKHKVGRQTFYRLADFAKPAEKEPADAPAMRAKKTK
jgi:hypothetical protein